MPLAREGPMFSDSFTGWDAFIPLQMSYCQPFTDVVSLSWFGSRALLKIRA